MVQKKKVGAKTGVGHWVGHMDDELGVGHVVCTKRQLFGETNKNTNYLSAVKEMLELQSGFVAMGKCSLSRWLGKRAGNQAGRGNTLAVAISQCARS